MSKLSEGAYALLERMATGTETIPYGDPNDPTYRMSLTQYQRDLVDATPRLLRATESGILFWKKSFYVLSAKGQELAANRDREEG